MASIRTTAAKLNQKELISDVMSIKRKLETLKGTDKARKTPKIIKAEEYQKDSIKDYMERRKQLLANQEIIKKEKLLDKINNTKTYQKKREEELLKRFEKFQKKLAAKRKTIEKESIANPTKTDQTFKGGIGENLSEIEKEKQVDNMDVDDDSWMCAKLKFKKHIDDEYQDLDDMHFETKPEDYEYIDPKNLKNM